MILSLLGYLFLFSCQTMGEPVSDQSDPAFLEVETEELPQSPGVTPVEPVIETVEPVMEMEDEPFDPLNVPQQLFDTTLEEVQEFIVRVNNIIHSRKYEEWIKILSQEYIDTYSSASYLRKVSEDPLFKTKKIVLKDFRDFFIYNVVPSRININKVDDIEFITPTRVKAFTVNAKGQRLRLYELEKEGSDWKIVN